MRQDAVLLQGGPRDAAVNLDTSNFTTAPCGFSATARLSCWSLSPDRQKVTSTTKKVTLHI